LKKARVGFIYFVTTPGYRHVKIGWTINVDQRVTAIGQGMPGLRIAGTMPGTRATERSLHQKFAALKVRGEWFRYAPEIRTYVRSIATMKFEDDITHVRSNAWRSATAKRLENWGLERLTTEARERIHRENREAALDYERESEREREADKAWKRAWRDAAGNYR
jgi:hypothetical protein